MKLDNKGFAISGILYAVMVLFLTLIVALLSMISNRKLALDKYKKGIKDELNNAAETYGARVQISPDSTYVRINEKEIINYDFKTNVSGCMNNGTHDGEIETLCKFNEADITNLLSYKIYDEIGNEVIAFNSDQVTSSDNYKVDVVYYNYYAKDSDGNFILDESKKNLKIITKYLNPNVENIFYVRYYVVDNNNTLSKEATRTLVIKKYDNYINVINSYFKVSESNLTNSSSYLNNANSYKMESNTLVKDNNLLQYALYNEDDNKITEFYLENGVWYYRANGISKRVTFDEKFRVRYFTGTLDNLKSEVNFAYFTVE